MPGYDRSRIVGVSEEDLEEFICGICLGVFIKPTSTQCCGQTFCFDCINKWVQRNNTCPNDRKILTTDQLKPSPKIVTNLLNNMTIKCDFHEKGCKAVPKINDLAKHKDNLCNFNPARFCENCGEIKLNHSNKECVKRLVTKLDDLHKENHNLRQQKDKDHINYEKLKVDFERSELMIDVLKKRVDELQKEHAQCGIKRKRAEDPNEPKPAIPALGWFYNVERPKIRNLTMNMTFPEVAKELRRRWSEYTEEQKSKYYAMADKDKARYAKELRAYEAKKRKPAPVPKEESDDDEEDEVDDEELVVEYEEEENDDEEEEED